MWGEASLGGKRAERLWWNFTMFGSDIALFSLGLSISSAYTVLPLFAQHLTANNIAIAAIPAIRALGLYAPQLLVAPLTERRRHVKPFLLAVTVLERVPYLILALAALWLASDHPGWLLAIFFLLLLIALGAGGVTYPGWLDMIARSIPSRWLGRFMGLWVGLGNLLGIGGAALAAAILAGIGWPGNFALCFALTFAAMVISFVMLALGREPARPQVAVRAEAPGSPAQLRALWELVRADAALRRLLVGNALVGVSTMAAALYAVAAVREGGLSDAQVGIESTVLFVAMTAGYFLWGAVGDRFGHRAVLMWGSLCVALSAVLALGARGIVVYGVVFLLLGLNLAAIGLAGFTLITEFGPPARRPTYVALASIAYAPFVIGAPLVAGAIANVWGYAPVFVLTAVIGVLAALVFQRWVPDPRVARD